MLKLNLPCHCLTTLCLYTKNCGRVLYFFHSSYITAQNSAINDNGNVFENEKFLIRCIFLFGNVQRTKQIKNGFLRSHSSNVTVRYYRNTLRPHGTITRCRHAFSSYSCIMRVTYYIRNVQKFSRSSTAKIRFGFFIFQKINLYIRYLIYPIFFSQEFPSKNHDFT